MITTAGCSREERSTPPVRSWSPFAVFTVEFRWNKRRPVGDSDECVCISSAWSSGCHTRTCHEGVETMLGARWLWHTRQTRKSTLISEGRDGIRFFGDPFGFNFLFSLPLYLRDALKVAFSRYIGPISSLSPFNIFVFRILYRVLNIRHKPSWNAPAYLYRSNKLKKKQDISLLFLLRENVIINDISII